MLERLDAVDWSAVYHAYGPATDTPASLRMLLDADPEQRQRAYRHLFAILLDDSLRNQATAAAAPFLVELIDDPHTPDRAALLGMLACSVAGTFTVASPAILDDGGPHVHPILRDIYRAAELAVPAGLQLVEAADERLSVIAIYFLATQWRRADAIVPALRARLYQSPTAVVRAIIAFALGQLRPEDPELAALHAHDPDATVRAIAAAALLHRAGAVPERVLDTLIAAVEARDDLAGLEQLPCIELGVTDFARALCAVPPAAGARAIPPLIAALQRTTGFATLDLVEALLHFAFGDPPPPAADEDDGAPGPAPATLMPEQRRVLTAVLAAPHLWQLGDLFFVLKAHRLPATRSALAELLAAPA